MAGTRTSSEQRIAANRRNAALSTGPRTAEGKAKVRANAVKHGLTGAGIALPDEDAATVERRFLQLQEELAPTTLEGALLLNQAALMSVRVDRAARQESAALAEIGRHAVIEFDLAAAAEIDRWFGTIEVDPGENYRRLLTRHAGVDRLVSALQGVRDQLHSTVWRGWDEGARRKIDACFGGNYGGFPVGRADALLAALHGDFRHIPLAELAGLPQKAARIEWARLALIALVDVEVDRLKTHRARLDPTIQQADRREATARASFDPSPAALLARRYATASARAFERALRDFHALPVPPTESADSDAPATEINPDSALPFATATDLVPDLAGPPPPPAFDPPMIVALAPVIAAEVEPDPITRANPVPPVAPARVGSDLPDKAKPDQPAAVASTGFGTDLPANADAQADPAQLIGYDSGAKSPVGTISNLPTKANPTRPPDLERPDALARHRQLATFSLLPPEMRRATRPGSVQSGPGQ